MDGPASSYGAHAPTRAQAALIALARSTPLRRGAARKSVSRLLTALRPGPIDARFRGAAFRLHLGNSPTEAAMLLNPGYNRFELDRLTQAVRGGGVFVDVGANVGLYALPLARAAGPLGRVFAIEAGPTARARLEANIALNEAANVAVIPQAVGDHTGEVRFNQDAANLGHSHISDAGEIVVPLRPLAEVLSDAGVTRIDGLKIDVEGVEDRVLVPFFAAWPAEHRPRAIVIEHTERLAWADDCLGLCGRLGYREIWKGKGNTLLELLS